MDPELDDIKKILIKRENMFAQEMKNKNAERLIKNLTYLDIINLDFEEK